MGKMGRPKIASQFHVHMTQETGVEASERASCGDNSARRGPLQRLSRQVSFFRLCFFPSDGCPRFCPTISICDLASYKYYNDTGGRREGAAESAPCFLPWSSQTNGLVYELFFY
jgi:hypothetical protein